jgi:hypothetical protein
MPAFAERGRVRLSKTSIVSDWGTPLRGAYWSLDNNGGRMPNRSDVANIKNLGLNAMHIWPECYRTSTGAMADKTEQLVKWCADEGLYAVICYGCCDQNTKFYLNKVTAFWKVYASRFANYTNVVYEIQNEPQWFSCSYEDSAIDMEVACYKIIRERAPDTHVLFFSYCNIYCGAEPVIRDVGRLGSEIDWSNASVAFHGYLAQQGEPSPQTQKKAIEDLSALGIRMTCTEFGNELINNVPVYEETEISYFYFKRIHDISNHIKYVVNKTGVSWKPDYGTWPEPHVLQEAAAFGLRKGSLHSLNSAAPFPYIPFIGTSASRNHSGFAVHDLQGRKIAGHSDCSNSLFILIGQH